MELLLILSAMLTALTGAMTGTRAAEARMQQNCAVAVATAAATTRIVASADRSWLALAMGWAIEKVAPARALVLPVRSFAIHMDKPRE